jgi:hypothetical protein
MASKKTTSTKTSPSAKARDGSKLEATATPTASKESRKLVRDSFTMPKSEYADIDTLKSRALGFGRHAKKSEILRAGLRALMSMSDRSLANALNAVPTLKTGRPKRDAGDALAPPVKAAKAAKAATRKAATGRARASRKSVAGKRAKPPIVDASPLVATS